MNNKTALLLVDLQYLDCAPGYGIFQHGVSEKYTQEDLDQYYRNLELVVAPNAKKILDMFRSLEYEVIHCRIQSATLDGRERCLRHKELGIFAAPGSIEAEFLPEVRPIEDEIVINKFGSNVFVTSPIALILHNLGIHKLVIAGVLTNECVSSAARNASDLGFHTIVVEDACGAIREQTHENAIADLKRSYVDVFTTAEVIEWCTKEHILGGADIKLPADF